MQKLCKSCNQNFEITDEDLKFYEGVEVPSPTLCPEDRAIRRMAFANQRNLYKRKCDATGKIVISNFSADKSFPVYDTEYFFSDKWNQLFTGRDFDFNRSFFEQFNELMQVAPKPALQRSPSFDQNSEYTNYAGKNKNSYLIFDSDKNEDCYYSYSINSCRNSIDCFRVSDSELAYECIDCCNCYNSKYLQNCDTCRDCYFLKNCIGCSNCFGCINLRNKEFWILNKQYTKEDYEKNMQQILTNPFSKLRADFQNFIIQFPNKDMEGFNNEDVFGNYLTECKNAYYCFDSRKLWDCKHMQQVFNDTKDSMDCTEVGDSVEKFYECCYVGYNAYFNRFTTHCLGQSSYLNYCYYTPFSSYLFGCIGLHHKKYCILNKQYTKEEYEILMPKIIEYMKSTGEFGEFFPINISPFGYNETHAFDLYPMTKKEVESRQWHDSTGKLKWKEEEKNSEYFGPKIEIPDDIKNVSDQILDQILTCEICSKNYKIIKQELKFYKEMNLPIPKTCQDCRHKKRLGLRNPRKLYDRNCMKCNVEIKTTYAPDRKEIVYCEKCYLESVC